MDVGTADSWLSWHSELLHVEEASSILYLMFCTEFYGILMYCLTRLTFLSSYLLSYIVLRGRGWARGGEVWSLRVPDGDWAPLHQDLSPPPPPTGTGTLHLPIGQARVPSQRSPWGVSSVLIFVFITLSFTVGTFAPPFALLRWDYHETTYGTWDTL